MNIANFIKSNQDLKDLPFLVVFRTIQVLRENGYLEKIESDENVDRVQP